MNESEFVQHLSNAIRQLVRQGELVKVVNWTLEKNNIQGQFITADRQLYEFSATGSGFSSRKSSSRSDAFVEGLILQRSSPIAAMRGVEYATGLLWRFDRGQRNCTGKTSEPCGESCIPEKHQCHVDSPEAKRVARKLIEHAKGLKLGSSIATQRNEAAIAATLKDVEANLLPLEDHEELVVVGADGAVLSHIKGDATSVYIPPEEIPKFRGNILTHNHPSWNYPPGDPRLEGRSLSLPDVQTATMMGLSEIRAVAPGYTYSLKPGPRGWGNYKYRAQPTYTKHAIEVHTEYSSKIRKGEMSAEQAEQAFQGEIVKRTANELGWIYTAQQRSISAAEKSKARKRVKGHGIPNHPGSAETANYAVAEANETVRQTVSRGMMLVAGAAVLYQAYKAVEEENELIKAQKQQEAYERFRQQHRNRNFRAGR